MNYPLISEYIETIKSAEENFEQLKNLRPVLDATGQPVITGGGFAVVFKMQDKNTGKYYALKCFTKEQEGRAESYKLIAEELEFVNTTYFTHFKYFDKELFVDCTNSDETEFPVVLMDWVDGITLDKYIRENLNDQYALEMLAYQFSRLAMWLMPQPFAHGDLKPDNILVKDDGTLVLVDYDGMYVPAMKGQKARELGSPGFRHPSRTEKDFDEHIDDFSLVSILLSLKAISLQPDLLEKYGANDRLLFSEKNYYDISKCDLLKEFFPSAYSELNILQSLFTIALEKTTLTDVSFRLFNLSRPKEPKYNLSTEVTEEDFANAWVDEYGVKYSADRKRLLFVPANNKEYSIKQGTIVICDNAFNEPGTGNYSLERVSIPKTVTHIGKCAFEACFSLHDILLPDSIEYIGDCAFSHCYKVAFRIPKMVRYIGKGAFWRCLSLNNIDLPVTLKCIESGTFMNCYSLTVITIPDSVNYIGDEAFADCFNLKIINIPDSVESLGKKCFFECYSLEQLSLSKKLRFIGDFAFEDCRSITQINLPMTLTYLGDGAFECCESLTKVVIPESITTIRKKVFCGCDSLCQVTIPKTVTLIDEYAFEACNIAQIILPPSVKEINSFAFSGCPIEQISIPNRITSLGNSVFFNCTELKTVCFQTIISNIGENLFDLCVSLQVIQIPIGKRQEYEVLLPEYKNKFKEAECGWIVKDSRPFNPEEIAAVKKAEVVASKYGKSVCFFMQAGGQTYIPLSNSSSLTVGDSVDLRTAKILTLSREGKDDIFRILG
ncbi:MAG: leucine-rich repeat protein [Bacteroidaceae bacterium]|nr:leucine-rich repeat protein [Bacteroidaceae bacterium]